MPNAITWARSATRKSWKPSFSFCASSSSNVHGDSHYFRVDKPLLDSTGKRVANFTRVETFGDHQPTLGDVNWLKVNVDPTSREVFSYEPQIVNRDPILVP